MSCCWDPLSYDLVNLPQLMMRNFTAWSFGDHWWAFCLYWASQQGRSNCLKTYDSLLQIAWSSSQFPRPWIVILPMGLATKSIQHLLLLWILLTPTGSILWPKWQGYSYLRLDLLWTAYPYKAPHKPGSLSCHWVYELKQQENIHIPSSFYLFFINMTVNMVESWRTQQKYFNLHVGTQPE